MVNSVAELKQPCRMFKPFSALAKAIQYQLQPINLMQHTFIYFNYQQFTGLALRHYFYIYKGSYDCT